MNLANANLIVSVAVVVIASVKMKKQKKQKKSKITKKMTFQEIMEKYPELAETLLEKGMHCMGCPMAMQETLQDGCIAHGLNPDNIVKELNEKLK